MLTKWKSDPESVSRTGTSLSDSFYWQAQLQHQVSIKLANYFCSNPADTHITHKNCTDYIPPSTLLMEVINTKHSSSMSVLTAERPGQWQLPTYTGICLPISLLNRNINKPFIVN